MRRHELDEATVWAAVEEVVMCDHMIACAGCPEGGYKKLYFNPASQTYRIKTETTEATCKTAAEAARLYSAK